MRAALLATVVGIDDPETAARHLGQLGVDLADRIQVRTSRCSGAVIAADNFGIGFAGVALVTYMSASTSIGYTATQYALLSSAYTYVGKFAKGFSGVIVERLAVGRPLIDAYGLFFIGAGLLGIPALILCIFLARAARPPAP